jgi:hypothetical protein
MPSTAVAARPEPGCAAQESVAGAGGDSPLASFGSTIARTGRGLARDREPAVGTRPARRRQRPEQPGECGAHRRPRMCAAKGRNSAVMTGRYPGALLIRLRSATTWNMSSALSVNLAQGSVREQTVAA